MYPVDILFYYAVISVTMGVMCLKRSLDYL